MSALGAIEIHTRSDDTATIGGELIRRGHYSSIHDAALAVAIGQAQAEGKPLVAKAIDADGSVSWLRITPDGQSLLIDTPPIGEDDIDADEVEPKRRRSRRRRTRDDDDFDETDFYTQPAGAPPAAPDPPAATVSGYEHPSQPAGDHTYQPAPGTGYTPPPVAAAPTVQPSYQPPTSQPSYRPPAPTPPVAATPERPVHQAAPTYTPPPSVPPPADVAGPLAGQSADLPAGDSVAADVPGSDSATDHQAVATPAPDADLPAPTGPPPTDTGRITAYAPLDRQQPRPTPVPHPPVGNPLQVTHHHQQQPPPQQQHQPQWRSEPYPTQPSGAPSPGSQLPPGTRPPGTPRLGDFLAQQAPPTELPARWGFRGALRRVGIKVQPSPAELAHRRAVETIQRDLGGPRTIVVVNQKGGAGKTPTVFMLGAILGRIRGGFTLAWDNNENAGTLAWKGIGQDRRTTVVDLLHDLERFTSPELGRVGDLDNFVRGQGDDRFDLLASNQSTDHEAPEISADDFRAIHRAMARYYRVLIVDTGNNDKAANWQAALETADQIVVPIRLGQDYAGGASRTLDVLDDTGHSHLVQNAVAVVSQSTSVDKPDVRHHIQQHFGQRVRAITTVPYDPGLVEGRIVYDALKPETREAWIQAAAHVVAGL